LTTIKLMEFHKMDANNKKQSFKVQGNFIPKEKLFSRKWFRSYTYIIIGTFIMSVGYVFFITPHKITPGGVYGISIVLHHLFNTPLGLTALAFNIPITLIGVKLLGPRFGIKTVVGFILSAIFLDTLHHFSEGQPLIESDPLLSAIFGGALIGLGVGLFFKSKATAGGSDVISMIIAEYTKVPLGQLMIIVDSVIVLIGLVAFRDWKIPLYSWLVIFVMGKVIDTVLEGISYEKAVYIISKKHDEVSAIIGDNLNRGCTLIQGKGNYTRQDTPIIFVVLNRREVEILLGHVKSIDPDAFITVVDANKILGRGFGSLKDYEA